MELERDVERYLIKQVEKQGGLCLKFGQDGWPDRIVLLPNGRVIWVELKRREGSWSDLQRYRARQLADVGQDVRLAWDVWDVDKIIKGST